MSLLFREATYSTDTRTLFSRITDKEMPCVLDSGQTSYPLTLLGTGMQDVASLNGHFLNISTFDSGVLITICNARLIEKLHELERHLTYLAAPELPLHLRTKEEPIVQEFVASSSLFIGLIYNIARNRASFFGYAPINYNFAIVPYYSAPHSIYGEEVDMRIGGGDIKSNSEVVARLRSGHIPGHPDFVSVNIGDLVQADVISDETRTLRSKYVHGINSVNVESLNRRLVANTSSGLTLLTTLRKK